MRKTRFENRKQSFYYGFPQEYFSRKKYVSPLVAESHFLNAFCLFRSPIKNGNFSGKTSVSSVDEPFLNLEANKRASASFTFSLPSKPYVDHVYQMTSPNTQYTGRSQTKAKKKKLVMPFMSPLWMINGALKATDSRHM
ncbi:hypothetical protein NPIL_388451 [Nephila pilipes]|uniref:Uncharacterized protein n=1 Tax=Nephila pilipes TaxID=299642 RepID=A0A8X6T7M6_NEPPI|nr:hypothetical protein NPIL_388451 [Nephila pilipes]